MHPQHQYYRAFTAMWLHANFLHIFFNMIALLIVGPAVEVLLGKARFLALYLIAGLGGSVCSYLLGPPNVAGIGASGAIMGVLGAYVVVGTRRRLPVAPVVGLLVINFLIGFTGDIDWRAHLGGLVTGAVLAFAYDYAGGLRDRNGRAGRSRSGAAWPSWRCWPCSSPSRRPGPRRTSSLSAALVDSETKIAILFHQWARPRHELEAGSARSLTAGRDGVVRHLGADDRSSTRVRIVDGALRCLARQGIAKTTVDDIARGAGLSRATVYRTFPRGKEGILAAVVETEVARLFSSLAVVMGEATDLEDVLVAGMVESARRLGSHEALAYLLEHEPGAVLPYLTFGELDRVLLVAGDLAAPFFARWLEPEQASRAAEWAVRIVLAYCSDPSPARRPDRPGRHPGAGAHASSCPASSPCGSTPPSASPHSSSNRADRLPVPPTST